MAFDFLSNSRKNMSKARILQIKSKKTKQNTSADCKVPENGFRGLAVLLPDENINPELDIQLKNG